MRLKLAVLLGLAGILGLVLLTTASPAGADAEQFLFGHNNGTSMIVKLDTSGGTGTDVGPTSFSSGASGMATSRGPVPGPGSVTFAAGTHFGLLRATDVTKDYVVVVDTTTGTATKIVETSRLIGGRGIAFGPDGVTLYIIEGDGTLSTINTVDGTVLFVANTVGSLSLEFDPVSNHFFAISDQTLHEIDPTDGSSTNLGDIGIGACTLARSPSGTWFTVSISGSNVGRLHTIDISTPSATVVDASSPDLGLICGTAFAPERPVSDHVDIDVKPGSDPNSINCNNENGVIPVAILTTDDFDSTTVDHTTVTFEGASETDVDKKTGEPRRHEEDVDDDGDTDLVIHFRLGDTDLTCSDTEGTLTGQTFDGQAIAGSDALRMVDRG